MVIVQNVPHGMNSLMNVTRMKIVDVPAMVMNLYRMQILVFKKKGGLPFFARQPKRNAPGKISPGQGLSLLNRDPQLYRCTLCFPVFVPGTILLLVAFAYGLHGIAPPDGKIHATV